MRNLIQQLLGVVCRGALLATGAFLLVCATESVVWAQASEEVTGPQELIERYCSSCHNDRLQTAGLSFDHLDGILYPMRMNDLSLLVFTKEAKRFGLPSFLVDQESGDQSCDAK